MDSSRQTAGWRLGRLLIHPLFLLSLQLAGVYAVGFEEHRFKPVRVPDTRSYLQAAGATTVEQALSHYRTYGYPLLLRLVARGGESVGVMPTLQFGFYSAATLLFWLGLRRYTGSPWLAFAGATPLPYAWVLDLVREIMTDAVAASLTIIVAAVLLALAARPSSRWLQVALAAAVLATYQVRPAALFLVVWAPLMAGILRLCREGSLARGWWRWLLRLGLASVLPLLLFAGARWAVVGHFGLVSFGGTNLAGVAACFLDRDLVAELPEEHRRLAQSMLRARQRSGWRPMTRDSDVSEYHQQYSDNIWLVAIGAAEARLKLERKQLERDGRTVEDRRPSRVRRNEMLGGVARAILRARPRLYVKWIGSSFHYGLSQLAGRPWVFWPFLLAVGSSALVVLRGGAEPAAARRDRLLLGVGLMAGSYFLVYLLLLCAVSWPFPRYFAATMLFLPSALAMTVFEAWRRLWTTGRPPARQSR